MKKIYSISLAMLFMMTMAGITLNAAQCSGGGAIYVAGDDDWDAHTASADQNCCAGDTQVLYDVINEEWGSHTVTANGPNSSGCDEI